MLQTPLHALKLFSLRIKRLLRGWIDGLDGIPIVKSLKIYQLIQTKNDIEKHVENFRILVPPECIKLSSATDNDFLEICNHSNDFSNGHFERSEIFVCEVVSAYMHVSRGVVCTKDFKLIADSGMSFRFEGMGVVGWLKPFFKAKPRIKNLSSSIFINPEGTMGSNYWHWFYDCLPRVYSLFLAEPSRKLFLLMPSFLSTLQRETLKYLLPDNFEVLYIPDNTWVRVDRFILPSFVSRRENGLLPTQYLDYIKNSIFAGLGLESAPEFVERIYISRAKAKHRRVLNEDKVVNCLKQFGFKTVFLEDMSFEDQVALFRRAEIVVGAHGAGLGTTLFSGKIKVLVLYPNSQPTPFFFTQFKGLGQEHYFLTHSMSSEEDDFEVDVLRLEHLLLEKIGLLADSSLVRIDQEVNQKTLSKKLLH